MITRLCLALFSVFCLLASVASNAEARVTYKGSGYSNSGTASAAKSRTYKSRASKSRAYKSRAYKSRTSRSRATRSRTYASRGGASTSRACLTGSARALLNRIESQFGAVSIVSTCRPGARIRGTGKRSKHASGEAIDFLAPGGRKAEVVRWLMANHRSGGIMTYPGMNHIHVDIGYRFVSLAGRRIRSRA